MHDVIAAITTEPSRSSSACRVERRALFERDSAATAVPPPPSFSSRATAAGATLLALRHSSSAASNDGRASRNGTRSCGRRGPARFGSTIDEIEFERVGEARFGRCVGAEHALRFGVRFDQRDLLVAAAGEAQIRQRLRVDREDRDRRTVFGRHVADRRALGNRQIRKPVAVELDELSDHALLAQHLRDLQHEVGRGDAFAQFAGEPEADRLRESAS